MVRGNRLGLLRLVFVFRQHLAAIKLYLAGMLCSMLAEAGPLTSAQWVTRTLPGLPPDNYADPYNQAASQAHVPLVSNTCPFQRGELHDDECDDCKSLVVNILYNTSHATDIYFTTCE